MSSYIPNTIIVIFTLQNLYSAFESQSADTEGHSVEPAGAK